MIRSKFSIDDYVLWPRLPAGSANRTL